MSKEFERDFNLLITLLGDKNVKNEAKEDLVDSFCNKYQYFDSSKLDKYWKCY